MNSISPVQATANHPDDFTSEIKVDDNGYQVSRRVNEYSEDDVKDGFVANATANQRTGIKYPIQSLTLPSAPIRVGKTRETINLI